MPKLTLEKDDTGLHVTLAQAVSCVTKEGDNYHVRFAVGNDRLVAIFTQTALQTLGLQ